jgi:hypothetical protein
MQTVFSKRLLAGLRAHNSEKEDRDDTFQDSADCVDPDDSGPRLSVTLKQSPNGETDAWPAAQAEQRSRRHPELAINLKRHNRPYQRQQRRQALLHRPICSIPRCFVRCRQRSPPLCCMNHPIGHRGERRRQGSEKSASFLKSSVVGVADPLSGV